MSFVSKLFGGKPKEKGPSTSDAIQKSAETIEILRKKHAFLEKKIDEEVATIKANSSKNQKLALSALKRKKRLETQLEQLNGAITKLEEQNLALESTGVNVEVMKTMGYAAKAMKSAHNNMDVTQIENLIDDIKEQQQIAEDISQAISSPATFGTDVDDDELLKELEEMQLEDLDKELLETKATTEPEVVLPEVPTAPLQSTSKGKKKTKDEDAELAELANWAS